MLNELTADFRRHGHTFRSGGFWLLAVYRFGRWSNTLPYALRKLSSGLYGILITAEDLLVGSVVHRETQIGDGLHIIHPESVRIAPGAVIGNRVGVMQGVVVGTTPDRPGTPVIGDDVFIGAGAKILGPIKIGDRARIAANSLVINDVPPDATAIGVPAKVLRYTGRARGTTPHPDADHKERE
jgi:serine O-acetyltransferase